MINIFKKFYTTKNSSESFNNKIHVVFRYIKEGIQINQNQ